jgi:hypothetical protein
LSTCVMLVSSLCFDFWVIIHFLDISKIGHKRAKRTDFQLA